MPTFRKTAPKPTAEQIAKIESLEAEAVRALRLKEESWERSDTDGFLSQWANGMTADLNRKKIAILRNGGYARFPVLVDADGKVIATKIYSFANPYNYGTDYRWRLPAEVEAKAGRRWVPTGSKSRILKQLGLKEESRWFPAYAAIGGSGKGLSGCASAYVGVFQKEEARQAA
jgi:hypothetical protein